VARQSGCAPREDPNWWAHCGFPPVNHWMNDPPPGDGRKVSLSDTDYLWGHGGNCQWARKSLLCGLTPIFMAPPVLCPAT